MVTCVVDGALQRSVSEISCGKVMGTQDVGWWIL
jgi:hypothetical protein